MEESKFLEATQVAPASEKEINLKGSASKPKLQYHGQASPAAAEGLYTAFVAALRTEGAALVAKQRGAAADDDAPALVVACGTFGNRQALRAEMPGPFTHTLEF